jgi:hypothetical protein
MPIPKCPDAPALTGSDSNNIELTVHLVTPMFGGGVIAREVDETHPIRETSIRAHWRSCCIRAPLLNSLVPGMSQPTGALSVIHPSRRIEIASL